MSFYKAIIKPIFFSFNPETIHHVIFRWIKILGKIPGVSAINRSIFKISDSKLEQELWGLKFPNPVGLAAGFDKDAKLYNELADFGFGFIEIGTLTPEGQPGNAKPRLFRLPEDQALINRMGFNNDGVDAAVERLKKRKTNIVIGGNIGKNTGTEADKTDEDYIKVFNQLFDYVDYFVVNVSCPNVGNLTKLQEKKPLMALMQKISDINMSKASRKPLLLKIAPDLSTPELDDVIDIIKTLQLDGVVAANTSVNREGLKTDESKLEGIGWPGGLSGKPLEKRSTNVISYLYKNLGDKYPIIGVGGIHSEQDAIDKIKAGAKLVQVYTGFIYEGPGLVKRINKALLK
ncbi:MAG: quinone-dependent dihydroorotate dehydrogenase [Flavobacteriales bacterium]|nr:quinone-dependent dihydroorotate dehydrogenase [Flavobacteriales bacterium]